MTLDNDTSPPFLVTLTRFMITLTSEAEVIYRGVFIMGESTLNHINIIPFIKTEEKRDTV